MAVKLADVAAACDVDISTASRAMRNDSRVHADTQSRIQKMAKKMGYRPNLLAQSLAAGKTNTIAIIVHGLQPGTDNLLFDAASRYLQEHEYISMVMAHHGNMEIYERIVDQLGQGLVDGAIVIAGDLNVERPLIKTLQSRIPVVCLDRGIDKLKVPVVSSEQEVGVAHLVKQCQERGVKDYFCIFGEHNTSASDRTNAARRLLKHERAAFDAPQHKQDFDKIDSSCAILVATQWNATAIIQKYSKQLKHIDVYVGCFDSWDGDCYPAKDVFVAVQDFEAMARHAVEHCQQLIAGKSVDLKVEIPIKEFLHITSQYI